MPEDGDTDEEPVTVSQRKQTLLDRSSMNKVMEAKYVFHVVIRLIDVF